MTDIVYILSNQAMPGYYKIGMTNIDLGERIKQLSKPSGVPLPFDLVYAAELIDRDARETEQALHELFGDDRINPKREFFSTDPNKIKIAIQLCAHREVKLDRQPVGQEEADDLAIEKQAKKKAPFTFTASLQIPFGSIITFKNDSSISAEVINDREILYNGELLSVSAAAIKIGDLGYSASGLDFWMFGGEVLSKRRDRLFE